MKICSKVAGFAVVLAMSLQANAAQAACWSDDHIAAAKVREMETMLMVGSLRCRLKGQDWLASYNGFIRSSRDVLTQANERLRAHFVRAGSGLNGYDRYVTSLANRFGSGDGVPACQNLGKVIHLIKGEASSVASLAAAANELGIDPDLPGGRCGVRIAAKR